MAISTTVLRESVADLDRLPGEVRNRVGLEFLYALRVLDRPADPVPDEDDGPWCLPAHLAPSRRDCLEQRLLHAPLSPLLGLAGLTAAAIAGTYLTRGNRNA